MELRLLGCAIDIDMHRTSTVRIDTSMGCWLLRGSSASPLFTPSVYTRLTLVLAFSLVNSQTA